MNITHYPSWSTVKLDSHAFTLFAQIIFLDGSCPRPCHLWLARSTPLHQLRDPVSGHCARLDTIDNRCMQKLPTCINTPYNNTTRQQRLNFTRPSTRWRLLHLDLQYAPANGRADLQNHCLLRSYIRRGRIRFLESVLRDCSIAYSSLSSTSSRCVFIHIVSHTRCCQLCDSAEGRRLLRNQAIAKEACVLSFLTISYVLAVVICYDSYG